MAAPLVLSYLLLWALVAFQMVVLIGLVLTVGRLQAGVSSGRATRKPPGLEPGSVAPTFSARDVFGTTIRSGDLAGKLFALLFVSPHCSSCHTALEGMVGLNHKARGNVVVVCAGAAEQCRELAETYRLERTILDADGRLNQLFAIQSAPTAVLIDRSGRIQSYGEPFNADTADDGAATLREPESEGVVNSVG